MLQDAVPVRSSLALVTTSRTEEEMPTGRGRGESVRKTPGTGSGIGQHIFKHATMFTSLAQMFAQSYQHHFVCAAGRWKPSARPPPEPLRLLALSAGQAHGPEEVIHLPDKAFNCIILKQDRNLIRRKNWVRT